MKLDDITAMPPGSYFTEPLYHGSHNPDIRKFNRPPQGVFFSPHIEWAEHYGPHVYECYVWAPKVYLVTESTEFDEIFIDAMFDRDYTVLEDCIKRLVAKGYYAAQTQTDSEMVCVFPNAKIYTGGRLA